MRNSRNGQSRLRERRGGGRRDRGANYVQAGKWKPFAVRGGLLITGQQQYSGAETARLVIECLGDGRT